MRHEARRSGLAWGLAVSVIGWLLLSGEVTAQAPDEAQGGSAARAEQGGGQTGGGGQPAPEAADGAAADEPSEGAPDTASDTSPESSSEAAAAGARPAPGAASRRDTGRRAAASSAAPAKPPAGEATAAAPGDHQGRFVFGSYGRITAAGDGRGRPGRDTDIVAHGSRLDSDNYVELELRREDHWLAADADTSVVATLAVASPMFHYDGQFDAAIGVRNLYLEERDLGAKGLSAWAGSRMLRGDDIYLLDYWPLDNLNTIGGGLRYQAPSDTTVQLHVGLGQPDNPFYRQLSERPAPLDQFGTATVAVLDRLRLVTSLRLEQLVHLGGDAGLKLVGYGELHQLPAAERETAQPGQREDVPAEIGWVAGAELSAFTGKRDTHVNLFVRYASGLAAYGAFSAPDGLAADKSAAAARELLFALGGNWEVGPLTMMVGAYLRSFRNASPDLDFGDVDEGIVIARPAIFFTDWLGLAVEGSFQGQQRGVLADVGQDQPPAGSTDPRPLFARVTRLGVIPFVTPAGRGSFSRPVLWVIYAASFRDDGARALYPRDDPFAVRQIEHFAGIGAEWWFSSTSYGEQ